jgi:hypothetical protein
VLPAVLPNGNAQDDTGQHEPPYERLLAWTGRRHAAPDGRGNPGAVTHNPSVGGSSPPRPTSKLAGETPDLLLP